MLGVDHFGVELHTEDAPVGVVEGSHRGVGAVGGGHEALGHLGDGVPMAHPHFGRLGPVSEDRGRAGDGQRGASVLATSGAGHLATQLLGDELGAVTDTQDRNPEVVDGRVDGRRRGLVDRLRAAGQDDARGAASGELGRAGRVRDDFGVDVGLAHPAGDQLRVLGTEVDDQYRTLARVVSGNGRAQWPMPTPCARCRSLPSVWSAGATMTSAFWNSLTVW